MDKITEIYKKMLFEATDDDINRVQKANPEVDRSVIQTYADEADPKKGKGSRYLDWLVKGHRQGSHSPEDTFRLHAALTNFEKYKPKLEKKDIGQYKHVSELEDAVQPHLGVLSASAEGDAKTYWGKPEHHEKIFDNGAGLQVYHTKTAEASKAIYGGGHTAGGCHTSWCTAARSDYNRFSTYDKNGENPLYQIHTPDGKVYQDEFSGDYSGGLRGANDQRVKREDLVKEHPDLTRVPAFQGKELAYTGPGPKLDQALHDQVKKGNYETVLSHPHAKAEHLHAIFDSAYYEEPRTKALQHPAADEALVSRASEYQNHSDASANVLFNHPHFNDTHITKILNHEGYGTTKNALFKSDKLQRRHIEEALKSNDQSTTNGAVSHKLATDEDRAAAIIAGKSIHTALSNMKSPEMIEKHYSNDNRSAAISNENSPASVLQKAYDNETSNYNKDEIGMHRNAPNSVISDRIKNSTPDYIAGLIKGQKNVTPDHINQAFSHSDMRVRLAAIRHQKATPEMHDTAFSNTSFHSSISVSKSAKPEHLAQLAKSEHQFMRKNVAENKNTTKETLAELSSDSDAGVAAAAKKQLSKRK